MAHMCSPTTLVVLPGLDGTDVFVRPFLTELPRTVRPVVIEFPSESVAGYGELLELTRRRLASQEPYFVLAASFSGPLAVLLAQAEPKKVRGVILVASFLGLPQRRLAPFRFAVRGPVFWVLRALRRIPIWLLRSPKDPLRRAKAETWSRVSSRVLAARLRAIYGVDVRSAIRSCLQPMLCVRYDADSTVPAENAKEILSQQPSAESVVLPGSHLAMFEDPVRLVREVVGFMERVDAHAAEVRTA
jgi:pimeloyl-ACP methyl ester carboxylesterase